MKAVSPLGCEEEVKEQEQVKKNSRSNVVHFLSQSTFNFLSRQNPIKVSLGGDLIHRPSVLRLAQRDQLPRDFFGRIILLRIQQDEKGEEIEVGGAFW